MATGGQDHSGGCKELVGPPRAGGHHEDTLARPPASDPRWGWVPEGWWEGADGPASASGGRLGAGLPGGREGQQLVLHKETQAGGDSRGRWKSAPLLPAPVGAPTFGERDAAPRRKATEKLKHTKGSASCLCPGPAPVQAGQPRGVCGDAAARAAPTSPPGGRAWLPPRVTCPQL